VKRSFANKLGRTRLGLEILETRRLFSADQPLFYYEIDIDHSESNFFRFADYNRVWESKRNFSGADDFSMEETHNPVSVYTSFSHKYSATPSGQSAIVLLAKNDPSSRSFELNVTSIMNQSFGGADPYWISDMTVMIFGTVYARVGYGVEVKKHLTSFYSESEETTGSTIGYASRSGLEPTGLEGPEDQINFVDLSGPAGDEKIVDGVTYRKLLAFYFQSTVYGGDTVWHQGGSYNMALSYSGSLKFTLPDTKPAPSIDTEVVIGFGLPVRLDGSRSYDPDNVEDESGIVAYQWYVQRPDTTEYSFIGSGKNISFTPQNYGTHRIKLLVVDDEENTSEITSELLVNIRFINIIEHGWVPPFTSGLEGAKIEFSKYNDALLAHAEPYLKDIGTWQFNSTVIGWDSESSFTQALLFKLLEKALLYTGLITANPQLLVMHGISGVMSALFRIESAREAEFAAQRVASYVAGVVNGIDKSKESYAVNLIGHSRGGYVVSRASRVLNDKYKIPTAGVTTLDGFADDWQGIAGEIADGSIVDQAIADKRFNYKVEDSLALIPFGSKNDTLSGPIASSLNDALQRTGIQYRVTPSQVNSFIRWMVDSNFDWKAPDRPFDSNATVLDPHGVVTSNHINIHKLFFDLKQPLLNESPWVKPSQYNSLRNPSGSGEGSSTLIAPFLGMLSQETLQQLRFAQSNGGQAKTAYDELFGEMDNWLGSLFAMVSQWNWIELNLLSGRGNVELVDSGSEAGVRFGSLGYVRSGFHPAEGFNYLTYRVDPLSIHSDSRLSFWVGTDKVLELSPEELLSSPSQENLPINLNGLENFFDVYASNLTLLDAQINPTPSTYSLSASAPVIKRGEDLSFSVSQRTGDNGSDVAVELYFESNGIKGLQLGDGGDFLVDYAPWVGSDEVRFVISSSELHESVTTVYAIVNSGNHQFLSNSIDVKLLDTNQSWLTNLTDPRDVNRDGAVNPLDALVLIDSINMNGSSGIGRYSTIKLLLDVDADLFVTPLDVLNVIDGINRSSSGSGGEGELLSFSQESLASNSVDATFGSLIDSSEFRRDLLGFENVRNRRRPRF